MRNSRRRRAPGGGAAEAQRRAEHAAGLRDPVVAGLSRATGQPFLRRSLRQGPRPPMLRISVSPQRTVRELRDVQGIEDGRTASVGVDRPGRLQLRHLRLSLRRRRWFAADHGGGHRRHQDQAGAGGASRGQRNAGAARGRAHGQAARERSQRPTAQHRIKRGQSHSRKCPARGKRAGTGRGLPERGRGGHAKPVRLHRRDRPGRLSARYRRQRSGLDRLHDARPDRAPQAAGQFPRPRHLWAGDRG